MKKLLLTFAGSISFTSATIAQTYEGAIASRALFFNQTGLVDTSSLSLTPQGEGNLYAQSGSMNNTVSFEGKFYQVYNSGTELLIGVHEIPPSVDAEHHVSQSSDPLSS